MILDREVEGVEIWLHANATQDIIDCAKDMIEAFKEFPTMLRELGFITSTKDSAAFDNCQKDYCMVVVEATCKFLCVAYVAQVPSPKPQKIFTIDVPKLMQQGVFRGGDMLLI